MAGLPLGEVTACEWLHHNPGEHGSPECWVFFRAGRILGSDVTHHERSHRDSFWDVDLKDVERNQSTEQYKKHQTAFFSELAHSFFFPIRSIVKLLGVRLEGWWPNGNSSETDPPSIEVAGVLSIGPPAGW